MTAYRTVTLRGCEIGAGIPKIVVPVLGEDEDELLEMARALAGAPHDIVEWRADFTCADDAASVLGALARVREAAGDAPLIFTFRTTAEGGRHELSRERYIELNEAVASSRLADAIDVEISIGERGARRIIDAAHASGIAVIGSSHDFDGTPPKAEMIWRMRRAQEMGADIAKLAVMPRSRQDVLALLDAAIEMRELYATGPIAAMSMGMGVASRLVCEWSGSSMTFGSLGRESAPGQIPADRLAESIMTLHDALASADEQISR